MVLDGLRYRLHRAFEWSRIQRIRRSLRSVGTGVVIHDRFRCNMPERCVLGNYIHVGCDSVFLAQGGIRVDDGVIFGPRCTIWTANHRYDSATAIPYDAGVVLRPVHVEEGVWVGTNALILPGVRVGYGSVIGAGSVVAGDIPPGAIAVGNPCRPVKFRDLAQFDRLRKEQRWYLKLAGEGRLREEEIGLDLLEQELR